MAKNLEIVKGLWSAGVREHRYLEDAWRDCEERDDYGMRG